MDHAPLNTRFPACLLMYALCTGLLLSLCIGVAGPLQAAGEEVRGEINNWQNPPGWRMSRSLGGTFIFNSGRIGASDNAQSSFKLYKDTGLWYGNGRAVGFGQIFGGLGTAGANSTFQHVQGRHYSFKWNGDDRAVVFQLSGVPVGIASVSRSPAAPTSADSVEVSLTTDAAPPAEQSFWLRYSADGFASSSVVRMTSSGERYTASIPAQPGNARLSYYVFSSANTDGIAPGDADLMTLTFDANGGANFGYTVAAGSAPIPLQGARALWLDQGIIAWSGASGASYKLLSDTDGGVTESAEGTPHADAGAPGFIALTASGTIGPQAYPENPNASGLTRLTLPAGLGSAQVKEILKGQVVVASYAADGKRLDATGVQIQGVLDHLYVDQGTAGDATLGVSYSGDTPTVRLWAPTARSVRMLRYTDSSAPEPAEEAMALDEDSGVWNVTGDLGWDRQFYLFDVEVYVPALDAVVHNRVTDPYAITLSTDTSDPADPRSQIVDLTDADLKPAGWDNLAKPALDAFEDIVVYEMHARDFSINDATVAAGERGTYLAFTYDGARPDPNAKLSDGMKHLLALKDAGLTHVHLLPVFDIASVPENDVPRTVDPAPAGFPRDSEEPQAAVGAVRATDGFNWGYDPYHYGAPEGSYSTDPNGAPRILEFRRLVSSLNRNGLRVVMDVVYNHTAARDQEDKSVLDKVVPGYYHRYRTDGMLYTTSCCADTAAEYAMMEKLMIDTLLRWARAYKVDGFRFDLMNLHTRENMRKVGKALLGLTVAADGVDGSRIYLYGEGWDFGSAAEKGLTTCPNCYAKQHNMGGAGIGLFNDKIRDAAHGGFDQDPLQVRRQGFINGLGYDWNAYCYRGRGGGDLHRAMDVLRSSLRGSGADWNGQGDPFTEDPQESVPYVEKHDNETLFDQNVFKLANGPGDPGACGSGYVAPGTSMAERVRAQSLGLSLVGLAQGVPFFQMGGDLLRSKSLDRNSYDSGDWFNRVFWDASANNYGQGLPPAGDNQARWGVMRPLLADAALDPSPADIEASAAHLREILRIRKSSPLFRLRTEADAHARVTFYNTGNDPQALLVMGLDDGAVAPDLDPAHEYIMVLFNANKVQQSITLPQAMGKDFSLHPVHLDAVDVDPVVQQASFDKSAGRFTIPARTTAVFVSGEPPVAPSTLDFVGLMYPRGGVANRIDQDAFGSSAFDVFVQVYEPGVTDASGQGADIACSLHWGRYGQPWTDVAMSYNADKGQNDEYKATLSQATLSALAPGSYGYNAFCKKAGEDGKRWKQDSYDVNGNALDDDQGDGLLTVVPQGDPSPEPTGGAFVHLFEWRWPDIEKECSFLAQKGYSAVQVSPPMEHVPPVARQGGNSAAAYPWWVRYQPVSHDATRLLSRSGTQTELRRMVDTCSRLGVGIIVDAVINHTTGVGSGTGTAGSTYAPYRYPQYDDTQFHHCGTNTGDSDPANDHNIDSYGDRVQVQNCELQNLADLDTGKAQAQSTLRAYLQGLLDMGVAGFRIDAAKHMAARDIAAILQGLTRPDGSAPYIFQEVIDQGGEPIKSFEYTVNGDVTEFRYSVKLGNALNCAGHMSTLRDLEQDFLSGRYAVVFTDNHDNQRGHGAGGACVLDHRDGRALYNLGNIFMLAYPYGYPSVMSSYYWSQDPGSNTGDSKGPPSAAAPFASGSGAQTRPVYGPGQGAGEFPANCSDAFEDGKWVCEHRRTAIANMVQFRRTTAGEPITHWQTVSPDHIAFGRGSMGFVAINRESDSSTTTYQTGLPAGPYCDVTKSEVTGDGRGCTGRVISVAADGRIMGQTLGALDALAIHVAAAPLQP